MIGRYYKFKALGYKTLFVGNGAITMIKGKHTVTIFEDREIV